MKKFIVLAVLLLTALGAFAQGNGMQGITDVTTPTLIRLPNLITQSVLW